MSWWLGRPEVKVFYGLDLTSLPLNHAYVVCNTSFQDIGVYSVDDDCYGCPLKLMKTLHQGEYAAWQVDTSVQKTWYMMNDYVKSEFIDRKSRSGLQCELRPVLGEFGVYKLDVGYCGIQPVLAPAESYLPFFICVLIFLISGMLYSGVKSLIKRYAKLNKNDGDNIEVKKDENRRILSLKVMRGILLSLIIFLTTGGGGYPFAFREWGGLNLTDFLFYCFIWTVGVKIPSTIDKALGKEQKKLGVFYEIIKRSLTLIIAGVVIDSTKFILTGPELTSLWSPLQTLGISYLLASLTYLVTMQKSDLKPKNIFTKAVSNVVSLLWCWILTGFMFAVVIILVITMLSFNCQGNIEIIDEPSFVEVTNSCINDMTKYVNGLLLGEWGQIVSLTSYYAFTKGILSIISAIIVCLIGMKAGIVYVQNDSHSDRLKLWSIWTVIFGMGAVILIGISIVLKFNLWPLASLLFISSTSFLIFSITYTILESSQLSDGGIFRPIGVTSIAILYAHLLFSKSFPLSFYSDFNNHFYYLLQNVWIVSFWMVIATVLMKKGVSFAF